jgi:hypothetical protein
MHPSAGVVSPQPAIALPHSDRTLALAFSAGVPGDDTTLDCSGGGTACQLHLAGLRGSLANGFSAGFASAYHLVPDHADLTLQLQSLELVFDADQHLALRYVAELDDHGTSVGRSAGTLPYTQARASFDAAAALRDQLARLFEKIAAECFPR